MIGIKNKWNQLAMTGFLAAGLTAFAIPAGAQVGGGYEHRLADEVQIAQSQLHDSGLYNGPVNGKMNHRTHMAIRQFQRNNDLRANGRLDKETRTRMGITVPSQIP